MVTHMDDLEHADIIQLLSEAWEHFQKVVGQRWVTVTVVDNDL